MVYFVGAGSGAVDLITLRGVKCLKEADVIIYAGSLVNAELLGYAKRGCKVYDSAYMTLEEVLNVVYEACSENKTVVRLHSGDPCLYGAIRDQMDALDLEGIPYENVPGVSSFCGAASALHAEYTLPGVSQSVLITRMSGRTPVPECESIRSLASHRATMVVVLSAGMTDVLQEELIAGGYPGDTPAAIVYKATWPDEKVVRCDLSTLHRSAQENGIESTALILVGGFLDDKYDRSKLYDPKFTTGFRKGNEE